MNFNVNDTSKGKMSEVSLPRIFNNSMSSNQEIALDFGSQERTFVPSYGTLADLETRMEEFQALISVRMEMNDKVGLEQNTTEEIYSGEKEADKLINPSLRDALESIPITEENIEEYIELLNLDDEQVEEWLKDNTLSFVTLDNGDQVLRITDKETGKPVADYNYGSDGEPYDSRTLITYSYDDRGNCRVDHYVQGLSKDSWMEQMLLRRPFYFSPDGERIDNLPPNWKNDFEQNPIHGFYYDEFN